MACGFRTVSGLGCMGGWGGGVQGFGVSGLYTTTTIARAHFCSVTAGASLTSAPAPSAVARKRLLSRSYS